MKRLQIYFLQWKVSKNAIYNDRDYVDVRPEHVAITVALSKYAIRSPADAVAKCFLYDEEKKLLSWKDIDLKKCASSEIYALQGIEMYLEGDEMNGFFRSLTRHAHFLGTKKNVDDQF